MRSGVKVFLICMAVFACIWAVCIVIGLMNYILIGAACLGVGYGLYRLGKHNRSALGNSDHSMRKLDRELKKLNKRP